jgi:hypothetical protein
MFGGGCTSLTGLPSDFNLPQSLTTVGEQAFGYMFNECAALSSLPTSFAFPTNLIVTNGRFAWRMFAYTTSLTNNISPINLKIPNKSGNPTNFCMDMFEDSNIVPSPNPPQAGTLIPISRG